MKEEYRVLFQRGYEEKANRWLNGGMCYGTKSYFDTLEEAIKCRDIIIAKEKIIDGKYITKNGIGIEIEYESITQRDETKLKRIKIEKRQVTEWEII